MDSGGSGTATAAEACFSRAALELEPRALPPEASPLQVWTPPRRVSVAWRRAALGPETRARLAGLEGAALLTRPPSWEQLVCPRPALAELAEVDPIARLLLVPGAAAAAPPPLPRLMGIVNVTPDSFSDGGRFLEPARALEHGLALVDEGADVLDVGGESTRPGSAPVPEEEEARRVLPVIEGLAARTRVPISVDTRRAGVARRALAAGARWVNDVSAGRGDAGMLELVAEAGCRYVLMHMQGLPRDMQRDPRYRDTVPEVLAFLRQRTAACLQAGIHLSKIHLDPGIGFGKRLDHNLELLRRLPELRSLGLPLLLGVSRKSFIDHLGRRMGAGEASREAAERSGGSAAAVTACVLGGASILRVHDVHVMAEAARVAAALLGHCGPDPAEPNESRPGT